MAVRYLRYRAEVLRAVLPVDLPEDPSEGGHPPSSTPARGWSDLLVSPCETPGERRRVLR